MRPAHTGGIEVRVGIHAIIILFPLKVLIAIIAPNGRLTAREINVEKTLTFIEINKASSIFS